MKMFFHGIQYDYLLYQNPILSPRLTIDRQNETQKRDREHLINRFGFEPVHFLESSKNYQVRDCLEACFSFGNVIMAFDKLPLPLLQLSAQEIGTLIADIREAKYIFIKNRYLMEKIKSIFTDIPLFIVYKPTKLPKKIIKMNKYSKENYYL